MCFVFKFGPHRPHGPHGLHGLHGLPAPAARAAAMVLVLVMAMVVAATVSGGDRWCNASKGIFCEGLTECCPADSSVDPGTLLPLELTEWQRRFPIARHPSRLLQSWPLACANALENRQQRPFRRQFT